MLDVTKSPRLPWFEPQLWLDVHVRSYSCDLLTRYPVRVFPSLSVEPPPADPPAGRP